MSGEGALPLSIAEPLASDPAVRLRGVPWRGLAGLQQLVLPAIAATLDGAPAERIVDRTLRSNRELTGPQRTAAVAAIFGVALWRRRLRWHVADGEGAGHDVAHAAPVTDLPAASRLIFALLRDLAGLSDEDAAALSGLEGAPPARRDPPDALALRWSFPDWIADGFARDFGGEAGPLCAALNLPGPICLRANRLKIARDELARRLADEGVETRPGRWSPLALIVHGARPNVLGLPAHREGLFEVQDEGSQLLGLLVDAKPGETILDLCAGAGGKTLLLAAEADVDLHAHDVDLERLDRLQRRAERAGVRRLRIHRGTLPADLRADAVLIDAPCSELGSLRRGPDARFRVSKRDADALPALQLRLLEQAARHLRHGGRLVYATCTLRREENEAVVAAFLSASGSFRMRRPPLAGVPAGMLRGGHFLALPHQHGTDGFFGAVLESA